MKIDNLISLLIPEGKIILEENFELLLMKFESKKFSFVGSLPKLSEYINKRDKLQILTTIGEDEPIRYDTTTNDFAGYLNKCQQRVEILEIGEDVQTSISVYKSLEAKTLSVYSITSFTKYLETLTLINILSSLKKLGYETSELTFESQSDNISLSTQSLQFTTADTNKNTVVLVDRGQAISKQKSAGSFNLLEDYSFTPDDFNVVQFDSSSESSKKIKLLLDKLCTLYSIGFIYDIVSVTKDLIDYKLNGYKVFKDQVNYTAIPTQNKDEYFSIYSWCYNSGNFNDKIGLSRNIVSLHLEGVNQILLKGNPFQAIQSGYRVYEKQNIKQYIEIRNKMSDQILAFSEKANKIVEAFASGFQKTALAFVSLFATIVISRVLTAHNFENIFTLDATIIAIIFLGISLIYFFVCKWEVNEQQSRFKISYENMKERNTDLLTKDDIERILNSDKEFSTDYIFIGKKKRFYSIAWVSFIILFTLLVSGLYIASLFKSPKSSTEAKDLPRQIQQKSIKAEKNYAKKDSVKNVNFEDSQWSK